MARFWVDSDGLIESSNHGYAFDLVPQFWDFLVAEAEADHLTCPMKVYEELTNETYGPLRDWAVANRDSALFIEPSEEAQKVFQEVADHVWADYSTEHAEKFLEGADPWLIAHAKAEGGLIVTHETIGNLGAKKVKIPNICNDFGLKPPINIYELARRLAFKPG